MRGEAFVFFPPLALEEKPLVNNSCDLVFPKNNPGVTLTVVPIASAPAKYMVLFFSTMTMLLLIVVPLAMVIPLERISVDA